MKTFFILIFSFFTISLLHAKPTKVDNSCVDSLDLVRYMGHWYEIARFNTFFEHDVDYVSAHYTMQPNGQIAVVNTSMNGNKQKSSKGRAKRKSSGKQGELKVAFFLWFYNDYNVLELDYDNYSYALVGSKNGNYLWILSRTPQLNPSTLNHLLKKAEQRGYDLSRLVFCAQKTGVQPKRKCCTSEK